MVTFYAALVAPAQAFCGTYIGGADAELWNRASAVAWVREGEHTTLTMANDVESNVADFALVVPVPQVLDAEMVHIVDPQLFAHLDLFSSPRLVEYSCDEVSRPPWYEDCIESYPDYLSSTQAGTSPSSSSSTGVTVITEFETGEYDIQIVTALDAAPLYDWLVANGYALAPEAEAMLAAYLGEGQYFMTAKVSLDRVPEGQSWLSPLQIEYDSPVMSLPLRLGTLNSPGEQELLVYAFADSRLGVSNLPEVAVEDECMIRELQDPKDFGPWVHEELTQAFASADGAAWMLEHSWVPYHCDPCTTGPIPDEAIRALGWDGETWNVYFSRLHLKYGLQDLQNDVTFYVSGVQQNDQLRYILHKPELESELPVCGVGMVPNPAQTCDDWWLANEDPPEDCGWDEERYEAGEDPTRTGLFGCVSAPGTASWALVALSGLLLRRRRA